MRAPLFRPTLRCDTVLHDVSPLGLSKSERPILFRRNRRGKRRRDLSAINPRRRVQPPSVTPLAEQAFDLRQRRPFQSGSPVKCSAGGRDHAGTPQNGRRPSRALLRLFYQVEIRDAQLLKS